MTRVTDDVTAVNQLNAMLLTMPANMRAELLQEAVSFRPGDDRDGEFDVGPLRRGS